VPAAFVLILQQMLLIGASMLTVVALAQTAGGAFANVLGRGIARLNDVRGENADKPMTRKKTTPRTAQPATIRILPLIFLLVLCAEVSAEVASLSCSGTVRAIRAGMSMPKKPWTFSLIIDIDKKTATVNDLPPVPIMGDTSKNIIVFMASRQTSNYGVSSGTLNRLTGATRIHIIEDGLQILIGTCKPARKLL
jgi:hypothetical protein